MEESINVLGGKLEPCSTDPMTGWFRDGCCNQTKRNFGKQYIWLLMHYIILDFTKVNAIIISKPGHG